MLTGSVQMLAAAAKEKRLLDLAGVYNRISRTVSPRSVAQILVSGHQL